MIESMPQAVQLSPSRAAPGNVFWCFFSKKNVFLSHYSIFLLLLVWELTVTTGLVTSRLLPGLGAVAAAFTADTLNGVLIVDAAITLARALAGFGLAVLIGLFLAALMATSPLFSRLVEPSFFVGYPVPKIALFPIFTFIFGIGSGSKVAFTFLECLYPIVIATDLAIKSIPQRLIWSARNMGAGRLTILRRIIIPAALPGIFSGLRIALPVALTVVVVTEIIGDSKGLGYYITVWSTRFDYAHVYAGIVMVGLCGFLLDQILIRSRARLIPWQTERA